MKVTYSKNLVLPDRFTCELHQDGNVGKFYIYPLQHGFGVTVGNIFRRVLLSSIKGTAFTGIQLPAVNHECSVVDGIKQDVSHIIYNLRKVIIQSNIDKGTAKIVVNGPKIYKASDIIFSSSTVSVKNPELDLFEVISDVNFEITLSFESGVGDLFVDDTAVRSDSVYGMIPVDAHFSPVLNVRFHVEETRVGGKTDYDKLCIEIKTNGAVDAKSAMEDANTILYNFISAIAEIKSDVSVIEDKESLKNNLNFDINLFKKIEDIEFSARAQNCLKHEGVEYIGDLVLKRKEDMLRTPNLGKKSLVELENTLRQMGYSFDMEIPEWQKMKSDPQIVIAAQKALEDV